MNLVPIFVIIAFLLIIFSARSKKKKQDALLKKKVKNLQIVDKYFCIDEVEVPWGSTLEEVREILKEKEVLDTFGERPNLRVSCKDAFGFKVNEINIRAPYEDSPVLQVSYQISPVKPSNIVDPRVWVLPLNIAFGLPKKQSKSSDSYRADDTKEGCVVYNANWRFKDVGLSLSTYGGYRSGNSDEHSIAGLYLNWENEIVAAKKFVQEVDKLEEYIASSENHHNVLRVFQFGKERPPYCLPNFNYTESNISYENEAPRRVRRALRYKQLFDTPEFILKSMENNSVIIWKINNDERYIASKGKDSVCFSSQCSDNNISWHNLLPAKGSGGMSLSINGLSIGDLPSSEPLTSLAKFIGKLQSKNIMCAQDYDC